MKIKDFIDYEQPNEYIVESDRYNSKYSTPVLTAGQSFILGYTNESKGIYKKGPCIIFDDFTTSVHYVDFSFKVKSSAMKILTTKSNADLKYCYYLLLSLSKMPPNHKRQWISTTSEKNHFLPSIDKQISIVKQLDLISDTIADYTNQIENLDNLVKARFVEMFGDSVNNDKEWIRDSVERLCKEIYGGGTPSKSHPEYYEDGEIPWITSKDMKTDILIDSQIHINEDGVSNSTARIVPKNSVIMVIRSGILKHTLPVAINAVPITVNQDLKVFIPGNRIVTNFLAYQFKMMGREILSGVRAVTADNIEFDALKRRELIVPPIELQQQFADFVQQVDKSKFLCFHQKKIREIFKISRKLIFSLKFYSACRLWCEIKQYTFDTSNFMSNTLSNMNHNFMWNFSNSCCHNVNRACCTNNTAPFKSTFTIFNTSRLSCFFRKYFNEFSNNDFSLSFWICNAR